jgi:mannose-1-phosphate guanylyltransferase
VIAQKSFFTDKETIALETAYQRCRSISIDSGIMERAENVYVVLSDIGWSDLGTWKSVYENSNKDADNNVVDAKAMLYNTTDCVIKTPKNKLVVTNDLHGYIVAEFDDVLMICKKDDEQRVKEFVARAEEFGKKFI